MTPDAHFVREWGVSTFQATGLDVAPSGIVYVAGNGEFIDPLGIAVDSAARVFVTDRGQDRVQVFRANGDFVRTWGGTGSGDLVPNEPAGIAVNSTGDVFVVERYNHRVQVFDAAGHFIRKRERAMARARESSSTPWPPPPMRPTMSTSSTTPIDSRSSIRDGNFLREWGGTGSDEGRFRQPGDVAVDASGNVFVADTLNHRIQVFDSAGKFIRAWGALGHADGRFDSPCGVAIDASGDVYVADTFNNRIQVFDSAGNFIRKWGTERRFIAPIGIAIDALPAMSTSSIHNGISSRSSTLPATSSAGGAAPGSSRE